MSPEWLNTIASLATLLVIAASALAALLQLRHVRGGNQAQIFNAYSAKFDTSEFRQALDWVRCDLPKLLLEPSIVAQLANVPPWWTSELAAIRAVGNFFDDVGAFVLSGIIDERVVLRFLLPTQVLEAWKSLAPVVALLRHRLHDPALWENFEYLAARSERFIKRHPHGTYPHKATRMPADDSLVKQWLVQEPGAAAPRAPTD